MSTGSTLLLLHFAFHFIAFLLHILNIIMNCMMNYYKVN